MTFSSAQGKSLPINKFNGFSPLSSNKTCSSEKQEWIETHLGPSWVSKVVITRDKTLVRGDFLIDGKNSLLHNLITDRPDVGGSITPSWQHVLYDAPYNKDVEGKVRMNWGNWKEVLLPLLNKL